MKDLTVYEIESFTIDIKVPVIVESLNIIQDVQPTVSTVPVVESITHSHEIYHDVDLGFSSEEESTAAPLEDQANNEVSKTTPSLTFSSS